MEDTYNVMRVEDRIYVFVNGQLVDPKRVRGSIPGGAVQRFTKNATPEGIATMMRIGLGLEDVE